MLQKMKKTPLSKGILLAALVLITAANLLSWNFSSLSLMLLAGCFSLILFFRTKKGGRA